MKKMIRTVDGGQISCEADGEGVPVVFAHADFVDGGMWDDAMDALGGGYRKIRYDKQGYGASDPAKGRICRRRELESVIREFSNGQPVHLVGCSNGGTQAIDLALEYPGLVRSLTIINSPPSGFVPEGKPPADISAMIRAFQRGDTAGASEIQLRIWFDGPKRRKEDLSAELRAARERAGTMNRVFADRGTYFTADADPLDPLTPPAISRLTEIHVPVLVVSGALDHAENRRASRILADGIPGAAFAELPDSAHVPPMDAPEVFNELLIDFLRNKV